MEEPLSADQIFIRKLTDIILTNLGNENFGVRELAHESGLSRYSLNLKLHSISKKTVTQFIREVRLDKALEMLQHETFTVAEVAYRTGFGSPNYFNKCFHEYFGFPPGKARREDSDNQTFNIPVQNITDDLQRKPIWRNYILTISGIIFLIILSGTGGFFIYNKIRKSELTGDLITSDNRISIAVMPFRNMTNDTTWNIWQESIQQSLISFLSNNKEIKVRQEETINTFLKTKGLTEYAAITPSDAAKISQKIDANIFVYGSIKEAGNILRVDAQLINTKNREVLKSFEISSPSGEGNIFEISDTLRKKITDYLLVSKLMKENPYLEHLYTSSGNPVALRYYIYGSKAGLKGDWAATINWFHKVLAIDSNYFDAYLGLAVAYDQLGRKEQNLQWVIKYYNKSNQMPIADNLWANWAYACSFEPPEEQIKYLKQLSQIDDQSPDVAYLLGYTYNGMNQFDKAIPEFKKSLVISHRLGKDFMKGNWAYSNLGYAYHKTGQFKNEKKLVKEAEKYDPDDPYMIARRISLSLASKDTSETNQNIIRLARECQKRYKSYNAVIKGSLANIYSEEDDSANLKKADGYYREAISIEPGNALRYSNLGTFLIKNNLKLNEVPALMDKAMELASNKFDYYNYLDTKGWGLYKEGKYKESMEVLEKTWNEAPFKLYSIKSHLEEVRKASAGESLE